ncbi:protein artichoke-like [Drosophila nasuta]|uniref:protein artichoke-like n=1 Tax=Drosophila nasuta TaxID=42062 RepID=UPI00295E9E0B|nr:protein artichoke-like [Drosophila nasuta]
MSLLTWPILWLICCVVATATQSCEKDGELRFMCRELSSLDDLLNIKNVTIDHIYTLNISNKQTELSIGAPNSGINLEQLMILDLSQVPRLVLLSGGFSNLPELLYLNISGCAVEQLLSSHFAANSVLKLLDASHNELNALTKDFFVNLPDLILANFTHNALSHVELPHMPHLRELHLGSNDLANLSLGDCPHLQQLILNDNQLTQVDSTSFQQLPELLELQLSGNLITDIGKNTFQSLTKLRTLNLSRNALTSLPADVFGSSIEQQFTLQQLDLSHNNINVLFENQFELLGGLQLLDLSGNKIAVLKSVHFAGLISLRHLYLGSNDNMELRGHTFETLKQLKTLDLSHIGLDTLGPHLFGYKQEETESIYYYLRMAHMRKLNLNGNKLQHLHLRTFAKLSSLKELYLSNNALRFLSASVLDPIQNLRKLDVSYNQLAEISSEVLNRLNNITDLHIDNNQLTFLPNLNGTLSHLQSVAIKGNPWQCVCLMELKDWLTSRQVNYEDGSNVKCVESTFDYCVQNVKDDRRNDAENELEFWRTIGLPLLQNQNVGYKKSKFTSLKCEELSSFTEISSVLHLPTRTLQQLTIQSRDTKLTIGAANSSVNMPHLFLLDLSHSKDLELFSEGFSKYPNLTDIDITGCGLEQLLDSHFAIDSMVHLLKAGHNKLSSLSKDLFNRLPRLQKAYFNHNGLSHLELPHMPNLRYLELQRNKLTDFNLNNCPRLEHLDLYGNQITEFQITPPAEGFNSSTKKQFPLRLLDLSSNNISVLTENKFQFLGELEILDLSGNKFTTLKGAHFSGLTSLRHLSLATNHKMELIGHTFEALQQLETLDLSFIGLESLDPHLFGYKQMDKEGLYEYLPMAHMRQLKLDVNKLQHLDPRTFEKLPFLDTLLLARNALRVLPAGLFAPIRNLKVLDVRHNKLTEISRDLLETISNITTLHIDYNQLSSLPDLNGTLPNLKRIAIEGNPWQCDLFAQTERWLISRKIAYIKDDYEFFSSDEELPLCI